MAAFVWPVAIQAAGSDKDAGPRLLQAQLPAGLSLRQADCGQLVRAVRTATLAHHQAATAILSAAVTAGDDHGGRTAEGKHACACVVRIFRAAVNAAPDHASALLETAESLCPDCADALTETLQQLGDKNVVADPRQAGNDPAGQSDLRGPRNAGVSVDPGSAGDPGDPADPNSPVSTGLTDRDYQGMDLATPGTGAAPGNPGSNSSVNGFGVGFGAGFPGAPGFAGSLPGGGVALPAPTTTPVTSVVNG